MKVAVREWELEHGPETSVSSATLNFLTEDDIRGETSDDVDHDDDDEDEDARDHKLLKNSTAVSGLTASGLGTYMPKYSSDYSSVENLLSPEGGFAPGFASEPERVVRRPPSPPMRHRVGGGSFQDDDNDDEDDEDDLSILPTDGGNGWSSSTVAADILF